MTPFKWCVYMNSPIDFCTPLLKEMVRRWVSRNESFVLKQTMVPFTVGDVCMGLGLGVGGLDVNFDDDFDAVVCHQFSSKSFTVKDVIHRIKHSKAVSNMPFRVLDNIDNLYEYNWAKAVHTFVVNSLGNASRKIRQGDIRDLGLSGNVAVLQLWTVERLGLADGAHDIVFPRIMNWRSLKLRCNKIEELFKRKEICWEWFLRDEDRQNSIICAALHLEEGSIAEDDGDELGLSWEQVVMKKIEDNQRKMVAMDKDLRSLATLVGVGKEDYEKGNDGLKDDVEDVMDIGPVVSTVPLHDDTEDDNLLNVNRTQLYNMVIPFKLPWRVVSEISGQTFGTQECYSFGPRMQVGNTGILFATSVFMFFERRSTGVVKRICFSPLYATHVLIESRKRKSNRKVWTLNDYSHYFQSNIIGFDDIVNAEFLFVPIIHDGHWWCYAVKIPSLEMFALDSFGHKRKERQKIDNVIAHNLALLFGHLLNCAEENKPSLEVQHLHTPIQPNKFDCGVIVLKIMELWDGIDKYERKTMPSYTTEELQQVREHYVCQWILDVDNVRRNEVLEDLGML
ncbi:uncharacterized protein LOC108339243 [Vigna angularis]|uniref:uncharacterized protein LOC108339243 n=1 Tax=Phaseolus angularis TaxID=3914 RepID=UPI0022B5AB7B|nr:uncharacterized protein LOC108339243 [Vigna angularis]